MNIKQNKGVSSADAIIAIIILMIFTGIIATISTNIYTASQFVKRNDQATNYIVEIFEYAKGKKYENVNSATLISYIEDKYSNVNAVEGEYEEEEEVASGYTVFINVQEEYPNYIKQIDITVAYKIKGKIKTVDMSTLINI